MTPLKDLVNTSAPAIITSPKVKAPMPFPWDYVDRDIAQAFELLQRVYGKLEASTNNPINHTPARRRRIKSLKYKTKTCSDLLKQISSEVSELWF